MKFGLSYIRPTDEDIRDYERVVERSLETSYTMGNEFGIDISELMSTNIPKKMKSEKDVNPVTDAKGMSSLVAQMKREARLDSRLHISAVLTKTTDEFSLNRFNQMQGAGVLAEWVSEYKDRIEHDDKVDPKVYELLTNILDFTEKLPISMTELKNSGIGKKINKLGKCIGDRVIKTKCEFLVDKWKRMIEDLKSKKKGTGTTSEHSSPERETAKREFRYSSERGNSSEGRHVNHIERYTDNKQFDRHEKPENFGKFDKHDRNERPDRNERSNDRYDTRFDRFDRFNDNNKDSRGNNFSERGPRQGYNHNFNNNELLKKKREDETHKDTFTEKNNKKYILLNNLTHNTLNTKMLFKNFKSHPSF
jgi:hypothetical protein